MELEILKQIWDEADESSTTKYDREKLWFLASQKSNDLINKMKRNLFVELTLVIISFCSVAVYYFIAFHGALSEVSWVYMTLCAFFIVYFIVKYRLLQKMQCFTCQVKSHLETQLVHLQKLVRFYLISGTAMIPILLIFFFWLLREKQLYINMMSREQIAYFIIYTTVITIFMWFINKWWVNKLYGRHIQRLRSMLKEMSEENM
ncbi:MAG: hypothetical protein C5B52_16620 [Bacteroidetes bacterium]|nr:MAG: hypothetical protein C5B52_16620 [Bacteroidota bacterium]